MGDRKDLDKLGNIVAETLLLKHCFLQILHKLEYEAKTGLIVKILYEKTGLRVSCGIPNVLVYYITAVALLQLTNQLNASEVRLRKSKILLSTTWLYLQLNHFPWKRYTPKSKAMMRTGLPQT